MLFLGLGTALGLAFVIDGVVESMALAPPPYRKVHGDGGGIGLRGFERRGKTGRLRQR